MARPGWIDPPAATFASAVVTPSTRVVPVMPQTYARPKSKIALENEPSRKYLIAPSVEYGSRLAKPAST